MTPIAAFADGKVVISQVYGAGGNSGSVYKNDFIELYNSGDAPVNLNGWSVQYASATGSATSWTTSLTTPLGNVTLPPGVYYLVQEAAGGAGTTNLPTPNVIGSINMSGTAGKVALINSITPLTAACPTDASVKDFVGFGTTANCSEPTATPATANNAPVPSATNADIRKVVGGLVQDTDNNHNDFSAAAANPHSSPTLSINNPAGVTEGNVGTTPITFTVTLSSTPTSAVTVNYTTADVTATAGSDYTAASGTLTFAVGASGTDLSQTITVDVLGDTATEPTETFSVSLSGATNAVLDNTQTVGTGTILDDDSPPIFSIDSVSAFEGDVGTTGFTFTISLSAPPTTNVSIDYSTANGTATAGIDYIPISGTLGFVAGGLTTQTIIVLVNGNTTPEPDKTFFVNLSNPTGGATIGVAQGTGTIQNDDPYTIMQIQGHGAISPFAGAAGTVGTINVTTIGNVVTAIGPKGFFIQDTNGDNDPTTSDGVYVYIGGTPIDTTTSIPLAVGDMVSVINAKVQEYNGSTELTGFPTIRRTGISTLPAAIELNPATSPTDPNSRCLATGSTINPPVDGYQAANFACLDGMLVQMSDGIVTGPTFASGADGVHQGSPSGFYATPANLPRPFREIGAQYPGLGGANPVWDGNPEIVEIYYGGLGFDPTNFIYNAGQHFSVVGPIQGYQGAYEIYPKTMTTNGSAPTYPIPVPAAQPGVLTIGTQNGLHFFNDVADGPDTSGYPDATCMGTGVNDQCPTFAEYQTRLKKMAKQLCRVLNAPAVLDMEEVENYSVATDLKNAISTECGMAYQPYLIPGNDVSGINIALLVRSDVTVNSVTQMYLNTTTNNCKGGGTCLLNDRPPVLLDATFNGYHFALLAIYDRSLSGLGDPASPYIGPKRAEQAAQIAQIAQAWQSGNQLAAATDALVQDAAGNITQATTAVMGDSSVPLIIAGDFNANEFTDGYADVVGIITGTVDASQNLYPPIGYTAPSPTLFDTSSAVPAALRYSYNFSGSAEEIDHILLSSRAHQDFISLNNAHGNSDVSEAGPEVVDDTTAARTSDHDGQVVSLGYGVTWSVVGSTGTVNAPILQTVSAGAQPAFPIVPNPGFVIDSVTDTCGAGGASSGGTLDPATNIYTTGPVMSNCSVLVNFAPIINGICGNANNATVSVVPTAATDLCSAGDATAVTGSGHPWVWTCASPNEGTTASCSADIQTWTVTPIVNGSGGSLSPSTPRVVDNGSSVGFTALQDSGYRTVTIVDTCGSGGTSSGVLTTAAFQVSTNIPTITADCTVTASFTLDVYAITTSAGAHGTISSSQTVANGSTATITAAPDPGYHIDTVTNTCGGAGFAGNTMITGPITANCGVSITFAVNSYLVTTNGPSGFGTITPLMQTVDYNGIATFTVTPSPGYTATVVGDHCTVTHGSGTTWTAPITSACAVTASFADITPPAAPICTANPATTANGSATVTITCTVETGTTNTIPGAACTPNPSTGTSVVCTGMASAIGSSPSATSTDAAGNSSTATVPFTLTQVPSSQYSLACTPTTVQVIGSNFNCTVSALDGNNGALVGVVFDIASAAGSTPSAATCTTDANGVCSFTMTSAAPGSYAVTAQVGSVSAAGSPATVAFTAAACQPTAANLTCSPNTAQIAGSAFSCAVTAASGCGLATNGIVFDLTSAEGSMLSTSTCTTDASGTCNFTVASDTGGSYLVTANVGANATAGSPATVVFTAPAIPNCSLVYGPIAAQPVNVYCSGGTPGDKISIPGCTMGPQIIAADGTATCAGTITSMGNDPPLTITNPNGVTNTGVVYLQAVNIGAVNPPPLPVCTATPNPASPVATVAISCVGVQAGTDNAIAGATCTPNPATGTTISCSGTGSAIGSNPTITTTDPVAGLSNSGLVPLNLTTNFAPLLPVCTATPNRANSGPITIDCVGGQPGTIAYIYGCSTAPVVPSDGHFSCMGGAWQGSNPIIRVSDSFGRVVYGTVPLTVDPTVTLTCTPTVAQTVGSIFNCSATVEDSGNNPIWSATLNFASAAGSTPSTTSCTTDINGVCDFTVTSAIAGSYAVTAQIGTNALSVGVATVVFSAPVSPTLTAAVSRKTHGSAGTFDIPLNLTATVDSNTISVEPRLTETGGTHRVVFTFDSPISNVGGVQLTGTSASSLAAGTAAAPVINGNTVTVTLSNVADRKRLQITLTDINGVSGANASVAIGYLLGDATRDRQVTGLDAALIAANSPAAIGAANFVYNISLSGAISGLDKAFATASSPKALE